VRLADFELRVLRFSTQFFAELRNANADSPEENPLERTEDEWVSAFIGWLMLVPPFEEPSPVGPPIDPPPEEPEPSE
jgi:hypothetical protein